MSRDPAHLLDMLIAARLIQDYTRGVDQETFGANPMLQDAVNRRIEIIGEAARRVSLEFRAEHPEIPWQEITGIRSKLVHDYDKVNINTIWDVIQDDIPALIAQITPLVPPDEDNEQEKE